MSFNPNSYTVAINNRRHLALRKQAGTLAVHEQSSCLQEHELTTPPFNLKVEDLVNLWLVRYGNEWVDVVYATSDPYYKYVYVRLKALGELEQHYLTDRSKFVCRKPD